MWAGPGGLTPALGLAWANLVQLRLLLARPSPGVEAGLRAGLGPHAALWTLRLITPLFAPHLPPDTAPLYIDGRGIHALPEVEALTPD